MSMYKNPSNPLLFPLFVLLEDCAKPRNSEIAGIAAPHTDSRRVA
mgnify:CR=1 FL=1